MAEIHFRKGIKRLRLTFWCPMVSPPMVNVEHIALEKIRGPKLESAISRWYELCGHGGMYRREELGFGPLVGAPEILNGRSTVITTDADDPRNFVISYYGGDFNVYDQQNFVARRIRDIPEKDVVDVIVECFSEALKAQGPLVHRIDGEFDGQNIVYDRIIFPIINRNDVVDRLLTFSHEISRG